MHFPVAVLLITCSIMTSISAHAVPKYGSDIVSVTKTWDILSMLLNGNFFKFYFIFFIRLDESKSIHRIKAKICEDGTQAKIYISEGKN